MGCNRGEQERRRWWWWWWWLASCGIPASPALPNLSKYQEPRDATAHVYSYSSAPAPYVLYLSETVRSTLSREPGVPLRGSRSLYPLE